jgi:thiol-disulfide isomerase/thioredoxin
VVEVDKYGNNIELIDLDRISDTVEILPGFNYINERNQLTRFDFDHSKKYTVLYIWGSWCLGCWTQAPILVNLMKKFSGQTGFYALNHGDPVLKMNNYLEQKKYPFTRWRLDYKNADKLNPDGFPHYIVFDQQRRILLRTLNVNEVDSVLSKLNRGN